MEGKGGRGNALFISINGIDGIRTRRLAPCVPRLGKIALAMTFLHKTAVGKPEKKC